MRIAPRRIVVVGSVIVDILLYLESPPEPGSAVVARRAVVSTGAGYNLLAGAVRLALPGAYAGLVGSGPFGAMVRQALGEIGVPVLLPQRGGDSGFDVGLVQANTDGQPTFVGAPGVEATLTRADLEGVAFRPHDAIYLSGYDLWYERTGGELASWAADVDDARLLVFDPGPMVGAIPAGRVDAVLARTDLLSLNTDEAAHLVSTTREVADLAAAVASLLRPGAWVVLRAGSAGCWVASQGRPPVHVPARPATVVDTTGAGDAHLAALVARLAAGDDCVTAARWANIAASLAVERLGPSAGPSRDDLAIAARAFSGAGP